VRAKLQGAKAVVKIASTLTIIRFGFFHDELAFFQTLCDTCGEVEAALGAHALLGSCLCPLRDAWLKYWVVAGADLADVGGCSCQWRSGDVDWVMRYNRNTDAGGHMSGARPLPLRAGLLLAVWGRGYGLW